MGIEPTALCLGRTLVGPNCYGLRFKYRGETGVKTGWNEASGRSRFTPVLYGRLARPDPDGSNGQPDVIHRSPVSRSQVTCNRVPDFHSGALWPPIYWFSARARSASLR